MRNGRNIADAEVGVLKSYAAQGTSYGRTITNLAAGALSWTDETGNWAEPSRRKWG